MATTSTVRSTTSSTTSSSLIPIPKVVHDFFAHFPLHTYPPIVAQSKSRSITRPTIWIAPPKSDIILPSTNLLSQDVGCLKWQALIALRGLKDVGVRWDVSSEGAVDATLPSLQLPGGELLGAKRIPSWIDTVLDVEKDGNMEDAALEGYKDEKARDESRAWVSLLEGPVHAALILYQPSPSYLSSLISWSLSASALSNSFTFSTHLSPPPAPISGLSSLLPPYGERVYPSFILTQYNDAIRALSDRLGSNEWFLGSAAPTSLDSLIFAYFHCLLAGPDDVRIEITKRHNLVTWERRVRVVVQTAFCPYTDLL